MQNLNKFEEEIEVRLCLRIFFRCQQIKKYIKDIHFCHYLHKKNYVR